MDQMEEEGKVNKVQYAIEKNLSKNIDTGKNNCKCSVRCIFYLGGVVFYETECYKAGIN